MTDETTPITRDAIEAKYGSSKPKIASNPYFRTLAILATVFLALGLGLLLNGDIATAGILLGVGFSSLIAVLITGAITWQIRHAANQHD